MVSSHAKNLDIGLSRTFLLISCRFFDVLPPQLLGLLYFLFLQKCIEGVKTRLPVAAATVDPRCRLVESFGGYVAVPMPAPFFLGYQP